MQRKILPIFLLFTALIFISMPTFAQLSIGGKMGMAFTKVKLGDEKTKLKEGFDTGLLVNFKIHDLFSLRSGIGFIQKGFTERNNVINTNKFIFNYIEVPLLLSRDFQAPNVQTYLGIGPAVNFLLSSKLKNCVTGINSGTCEKQKIPANNFNNIDISLNFGAGIGFNVGTGDAILAFDARYFRSFSDAFADSQNFSSSKNNGFSITMSLLFPTRQDDLGLRY